MHEDLSKLIGVPLESSRNIWGTKLSLKYKGRLAATVHRRIFRGTKCATQHADFIIYADKKVFSADLSTMLATFSVTFPWRKLFPAIRGEPVEFGMVEFLNGDRFTLVGWKEDRCETHKFAVRKDGKTVIECVQNNEILTIKENLRDQQALSILVCIAWSINNRPYVGVP